MILSLLLPILMFSFLNIDGQSTGNSVKVFPPETEPFGLSYEDHVKNYWKWQLSLPIDKSPFKDETGEKCASEQINLNSSVFYLSGGGGGTHHRECKMPVDKGVLIPVLTAEFSDKEVPNASPEELSKLAKIDQDHVTSLVLDINGKKIFDEKYPDGIANAKNSTAQQYRTHTGVFDVVFPDNAIFGASAGPSKVVADGFYVITEPLKKGNYTIAYKGSLFCDIPDCLDVTFAHDHTYKLIVE
jgi:hypothetical protein